MRNFQLTITLSIVVATLACFFIVTEASDLDSLCSEASFFLVGTDSTLVYQAKVEAAEAAEVRAAEALQRVRSHESANTPDQKQARASTIRSLQANVYAARASASQSRASYCEVMAVLAEGDRATDYRQSAFLHRREAEAHGNRASQLTQRKRPVVRR